jgi:hypothetical protein
LAKKDAQNDGGEKMRQNGAKVIDTGGTRRHHDLHRNDSILDYTPFREYRWKVYNRISDTVNENRLFQLLGVFY